MSALFSFGADYDQASSTANISATTGYTMNLTDYANMWVYQEDSNCYYI